jgi:hypothetical protein
MYEGEDVNTIDLLYETSTDQKNGVKVIVPVRFYDRSSFVSKIKEQLAYFENVYFNVDGVDNDFTIMRHEHFQWSPLSANGHLHICLDNVYYPIDFGKLGIDTIYFPVGLRFSLTDGLFPTPNRESLRYTTEAKAVIMKKLQSVANYFVEKYNENVQDTTDIWKAMEHFRNSDRNLNLFGKNGLNVSYFAKYATIGFASPKVDGVYYQTVEYYNRIREYMFGEYTMKNEVSRGRFCKASSYWDLSRRYGETIYVYSDRLSGIKKEYLKSSNRRGHTEYIVKKDKSFKLGSSKEALAGYENYYKILQLNKFQKSEWRNVIKEFQEMVRRVTANFINLDTLQVPQAFIDSKKKISFTNGVAGPKERRKKLEGELTGKVASALERTVYSQYSKFVPTVFQMKNAHRNPYLMVYGSSIRQNTFDKMFSVFTSYNTKFMVLSERELKRMEEIDLHNWIHIDKFMEGDHIVFKRAATAYLINELTKDYAEVFNRIDRISDISTELYKKMLVLDSYKRKYHLHGDNSLYQSIIKIAEEKNLFDLSVYSVYNEVKEVFAMLPFLKPMFGMMSRYGSNNNGVNDAVRDLFKYYKQRIDWEHYNIKLNEEVVTPIVDLNVEELS